MNQNVISVTSITTNPDTNLVATSVSATTLNATLAVVLSETHLKAPPNQVSLPPNQISQAPNQASQAPNQTSLARIKHH